MTNIVKHNKGETYPKDCAAIRWPKYASPKLDGIRASGQNGTLITNSGKEIPNKALVEKFAPLIQNLDGEFIYGDPTDPDVYNKTFSAVMTKNGGVVDGVTFWVFDSLDLRAPFETKVKYMGFVETEDVKIVPQILIKSAEDFATYYELQLDLGYEGAMLRNPKAIYKQGRSTLASQDMLKLKPLEDAEFVVGEMFEAQENLNVAFTDALGNTQRSSHAENKVGKGMLGGFHSTWNNLPFKIAPGKLKHTERLAIWQNPAAYKGRIGVFTYMNYGLGYDVPRQARFKAWRDGLDLTE